MKPIDTGALDWLLPSQSMNPSTWTLILWCAPIVVATLLVVWYNRWKNRMTDENYDAPLTEHRRFRCAICTFEGTDEEVVDHLRRTGHSHYAGVGPEMPILDGPCSTFSASENDPDECKHCGWTKESHI